LAGIAALARSGQSRALQVSRSGSGAAARFAHAVGFDAAIAGAAPVQAANGKRTVPLTRFRFLGEVERTATDISRLLLQGAEHDETRRTVDYVLVELLRNVIQHSGDRLGGVAGAQLMSGGKGGYARDVIQVAVADAGMGIPESLRGHHPEAKDPRVALERALWPHVSGAFSPGLSGSSENAGLGLFFIAEIAKLTAGRLVIATRGATLVLVGEEDASGAREELLSAAYPGTLVAFELGLGEVKDYDALIETVQQRARTRTPPRTVHQWLRYDAPPPDVHVLLISVAAENTVEAQRFAQKSLVPRLLDRKPVALDFRNLPICTQSFLHSLLYEPLRLAWALRIPIYVLNAQPAVRSTLMLLEGYALGG
jgi:hypothetical protein